MRHVSRSNSSKSHPDQVAKRDKDIDALFRRWAVVSARASELRETADELRPELLALAVDHGDETSNGHRTVELAKPFTIPGGKTLSGFTNEQRVSRRINYERTERLGEEKGLTDLFFRTETVKVIDEVGIYGAHQDGLISDKELEELIDETTTHALKSW